MTIIEHVPGKKCKPCTKRGMEIRSETLQNGPTMQIQRITPHIIGAERNFLFVVIETDSGLVGVGEGGLTWRESATAGFIEAVTPLLLGADPFRTEHLWQVMFRSGFFPAGRVGAAAISALDLALWDIKAQALQVPLYQLLGGLCRNEVPCYPHARGQTTPELVEHARRLVGEGYRFIRTEIRGGRDGSIFDPRPALRLAIEDLAALRSALGPDIELLVDVHTRLDPADAMLFCNLAEEYQPYFIEDPLRCENPDSYRRLSARTTVPLAVGEQYSSKWEFRPLIENEWCDFARIDVCLAGGITETVKIAGWCETHGLKLALHNPLGPVSTAACLHIDLASSCFGVQELPRVPGTYLQDLFPVQVPYQRGHLQPPTRNGLGVVIDESRVKAYPPIPEGRCPIWRRADGSFTNW